MKRLVVAVVFSRRRRICSPTDIIRGGSTPLLIEDIEAVAQIAKILSPEPDTPRPNFEILRAFKARS
jgi:hypothetical protein